MTPSGVLSTLYTFCIQSGCADGQEPESLIEAADGNLYGTTTAGGAYKNGTLFEISRAEKFTTFKIVSGTYIGPKCRLARRRVRSQ